VKCAKYIGHAKPNGLGARRGKSISAVNPATTKLNVKKALKKKPLEKESNQ